MAKNREVERRFLVEPDNCPATNSDPRLTIIQAYLGYSNWIRIVTEKGKLDEEQWKEAYSLKESEHVASRLRWENGLTYATLKNKTSKDGSRIEIECEIKPTFSKMEFIDFINENNLDFICKDRVKLTGGDGYVWEIDIFNEKHLGLIIAEVEMEDINEDVKIPDWCGKEVTHLNEIWSNQALALKKDVQNEE